MRVLVTGGSGFVGREVVRQLREAGHTIRVLTRGIRPRLPELERVQGSVLEANSLAAAAAGCEAVIHLVGIISETRQQTFERVHVEGTGNLIAAVQAAGITRFVHMSALGTRPNAASRYHQSKWAAEELVRKSGLKWTLFRPGLIHGPGDGFVNLFVRMSRWSPVLPVIGPGDGLLQPVPVAEVARCFVGAIEGPDTAGLIFEVCGRERLTFNQVLDEILAVTGRSRLKLHVPWALARMQARLLEWVYPTLLRRAPPLNRDQVQMLMEDNVGDPEPAALRFALTLPSFRQSLEAWLK